MGSPHLALPLLQAELTYKGYDVEVRDLNIESAEYYGVAISQDQAIDACRSMNMKSLNEPYFRAEDRLMKVARLYGGRWSAERGFDFENYSLKSSLSILHASQIDSPFINLYKQRVLPWVSKEQPLIVGISIATAYQLIPAFQLVRLLRSAGYKGIIVMGGNTISRLSEEISRMPSLFSLVNAFIIFQGETPLAALVDAVHEEKNFECVPNAIWHDGCSVRVNRLMPHQNPSAIPGPDFTGFPLGRYWGVNYLPLVAARGCYWAKCSFCSIPYGWGNSGFGGVREANVVYADMTNLMEKYGLARFKFMDEATTPNFMYKLASIICRKGDQFEWECYARFERKWLNRQFVRMLAKSGLKKVYLGLETMPTQKRGVLSKNDMASEVSSILSLCAEEGIKVHLFCMFGFPGTSRAEAEETTEFILAHRDIIDTIDINSWVYAKHTYVPKVRKILRNNEDWALEYDYEYKSEGRLVTTQDVDTLVNELTDIVWDKCPRLLHPTYRLISPWIDAPSNSELSSFPMGSKPIEFAV